MSVGISFTLCSFFFITLLTIVFFSKKRLVSIENNIYSLMIITSLFGTIIGVPCYYFMKDYEIFGIANIITSKAYLVYLVTWITLFTSYIFVISFKNINVKKTLNIFKVIYVIMIIIVCFLPLYYENSNDIVYSYGPSANFMYFASGIAIMVILICLFANLKYIKQKKFLPLILFIIIGSIIMTIQKFNPGLLLITFGEAFITFLMYFTIENPDIKLINELNENKILVEKTNEEKSKILFKMIQEVKNPVSYIYNVSESLEKEEDSEKLKKGIGVINSSARKLSYIINNVLDVSGMDAKRVKVINNKYNIYTLLDEIKVRLEKRRKANVEYRVNISNNIPETLYGDPIKVKQILATILSNAIEHTDSGFIELTIDALVRYDMCRLIMTIEDSGVGMNLLKVNEILRFDEELSSEDEEKLQNRYLDLKLVKKMLKFLGGTMMIKSEVGKGSEFIVVLDQKIENPKNDNYSQRYNSTSLFETKRVLIVDDDMVELEYIANKFKKDKIDVTTTLYGKDCVDKINSKEKYDLILIDDEMPDLSGLGTLKELQKIKNFKIPTVIMFNNDKLRIKDSYLEDGFDDYLLKDKIKSESDKIINKYLGL